ncbi:Inhibitor of growth protein 4 [Lecanora helva]
MSAREQPPAAMSSSLNNSDKNKNIIDLTQDENEGFQCICGGKPLLTDWIACDNPNCPVQWYHLECLNLQIVPAGEWLCPKCRPYQAPTPAQPKSPHPKFKIPGRPNLTTRTPCDPSRAPGEAKAGANAVKKGTAAVKKAPRVKPRWRGWQELTAEEEEEFKKAVEDPWDPRPYAQRTRFAGNTKLGLKATKGNKIQKKHRALVNKKDDQLPSNRMDGEVQRLEPKAVEDSDDSEQEWGRHYTQRKVLAKKHTVALNKKADAVADAQPSKQSAHGRKQEEETRMDTESAGNPNLAPKRKVAGRNAQIATMVRVHQGDDAHIGSQIADNAESARKPKLATKHKTIGNKAIAFKIPERQPTADEQMSLDVSPSPMRAKYDSIHSQPTSNPNVSMDNRMTLDVSPSPIRPKKDSGNSPHNPNESTQHQHLEPTKTLFGPIKSEDIDLTLYGGSVDFKPGFLSDD